MDKDRQVDIHNKVVGLLRELNLRLVEREELSSIMVLALFSYANVYLVGERGVAKTKTAELINGVIKDSKFWQIQANEGTTVEDFFGEKRSDEDGTIYLPSSRNVVNADIVVVDEAEKAPPKVSNALLPVLNERTYTMGDGIVRRARTKVLIVTANSIPDMDYMQPLLDRMHFFIEVKRIQNFNNKVNFFAGNYEKSPISKQYFTLDELEFVRKEIKDIELPLDIVEIFTKITDNLIKQNVRTSDRKYDKTFSDIIKTIAYLNKREEVDVSDIFILMHTAWQDYSEKYKVGRVLLEMIFGSEKEITSIIVKMKLRVEEIDAFKNNHLFDYLRYKKEVEGINKEEEFSRVLETLNSVYNAYNEVLETLKELEWKYNNNLKIEEKIEENIFIHSIRQEAFTEEMILDIKELIKLVTNKISDIVEWYHKNDSLMKYQSNLLKKNKQE